MAIKIYKSLIKEETILNLTNQLKDYKKWVNAI